MGRIILTTESGADLPLDWTSKHSVQVVPMHVIMGDKDYLDGALPVEDIFDYYERTKKIPPQLQQMFMNMRNSLNR